MSKFPGNQVPEFPIFSRHGGGWMEGVPYGEKKFRRMQNHFSRNRGKVFFFPLNDYGRRNIKFIQETEDLTD